MTKSEQSDTRFMRLWKKYSWIFSSILFISLSSVTLFLAQGYIGSDLSQGVFQTKGSLHIKEASNGDVFINNVRSGRTGDVIDLNPNEPPVSVKITKDGRTEWNKQVKAKSGLVSIYYPILYPTVMSFNTEKFVAHNFASSEDKSSFYYTKFEDGKVNLYRYLIINQLFLSVTNIKITEITEQVRLIPSEVSSAISDYELIPSNTGRFTLLKVGDNTLYVINETGKITKVEAIKIQSNNLYFWSPNDSSLVIQSDNNIYSINPDSFTQNTVYSSSSEQTVKAQFVLNNSVVFLIYKPSAIDVAQNTFAGNSIQILDIPNIDNLRTNNIQRIYPFLEKQNYLIVQSKNNFYSYDLSKSELKKLNLFANEEVVYVNSKESIIVTLNKEIKNQFRYYDMEKNESKTYTLQKAPSTITPITVSGYNFSQNLVFNYGKFAIFADADGGNEYRFDGENELGVLINVKKDLNVIYALAERQESKRGDNYMIMFERFSN